MTLDERIASALERIAAALERLPAANDKPQRRRNTSDAEALALRAAARLLGIDRATTLSRLIRDGVIRTVPWGDSVRIPREEVERVAREGIPPAPGNRPRRRPVRRRASPEPPAPGIGDRILALAVN